jgi:hypothetical protein
MDEYSFLEAVEEGDLERVKSIVEKARHSVLRAKNDMQRSAIRDGSVLV